MSLLRKIKRNFRLVNNSRDTRNKHKSKVKRQSRIVLDALEPRVLLSSDLQALLMPADYLAPGWGEDAEFGLEIGNTGSDLSTGGAAVNFYMDVNSNGTLELGTDLELTSVVANTSKEPETPTLPLDFSADNLPSGESLFGQYTITMPASGYSDGDYAIIVSIDGTQVSDPDSSNNVSSFTIPIGSTSPTGGIDLNISDVIVPALESMDEMAFDGVYSASASIHNVGDTSTSGAVNVSFYLSSDMYLTPDAVLLTTDGTNPATVATSGVIAGGGSELVTSDIKMPASNPFGSDSSMHIIAVVDADGITSGVATGGTETEVYESNNSMPVEEELLLTSGSSVSGIDLGAGELYFGTLGSGQVPNLT